MVAGIIFTKVYLDDDLVELEVVTSDGASSFVTKVDVGHRQLTQLIDTLKVFGAKAEDEKLDIRLGCFGPGYANGAFHAVAHSFQAGRGHLFFAIQAESPWRPFAAEQVASKATLYLSTEPALSDTFVTSLAAIGAGTGTRAYLEAVQV